MRTRKRRKLVSDINVVPYIDVMLVLLIIFMVTAPLMNLSVDVDLPQSKAAALDQKDQPFLVTIDKTGAFFLTAPEGKREAKTDDALQTDIAAYVATNPKIAVLIAADDAVPYGRVYAALARLQAAKAPRVGFISQPLATKP